jgi:hypothetical protein
MTSSHNGQLDSEQLQVHSDLKVFAPSISEASTYEANEIALVFV